MQCKATTLTKEREGAGRLRSTKSETLCYILARASERAGEPSSPSPLLPPPPTYALLIRGALTGLAQLTELDRTMLRMCCRI